MPGTERPAIAKEAKLVIKGYENRKKDQRVQILCSRAFAQAVASGNEEHLLVLRHELNRLLGFEAEQVALDEVTKALGLD